MPRRGLVFLLLTAVCSLPLGAQGGNSLLLTPAQLSSELRDPRLVMLHVGPREDYTAAHIGAARFVLL